MKSKYQHSIAGQNLKPVQLSLSILEILVEHGVEGISLTELRDRTRIPKSTLHRYLDTLEECSWVEKIGTKQSMAWKPSKFFLRLAHSHRNAVNNQIDKLKSEYEMLSGEEL